MSRRFHVIVINPAPDIRNLMSEEQAVFTCPKCGQGAELRSGYETSVICKDCGETKIVMRFLSNGDIETVTEDTGKYYELEPSVREALNAVESAKTDAEKVIALSLLSDRYSETGREVKAENLANEVLAGMYRLAEKGDSEMLSRYFNQIPICAAFAIARGDNKTAMNIYADGLAHVGDSRTIEVASMKVNYGFICTMRKELTNAEKVFKEALELTEECFAKGEKGDDPYLLATIYDSLRLISSKNGRAEEAEGYMESALRERRELLKTAPVTSARLIELADSIGFKAESEERKGNSENAEALMNEAVEILKGYPDNKDAYANALMNRAKYRQMKNPEMTEEFGEEMNEVIPALEAVRLKDKRTYENLAQAYMFRSMIRSSDDLDGLLEDLTGAYDNLHVLAETGDVNEMFFMSTAHSYLVLLNMKDQEKAKEVRSELMELGISQSDLDRASRSTVGNINSKSTRIDSSAVPTKPIPGRRLRRQVKHKE